MHKRNCSQCGACFEIAYLSTKRKSCSDECRKALYSRKKPHERSDKGTRKTKWTTVACGHCGTLVERVPSQIRKNEKLGWNNYCSWQCRTDGTASNSGRPTKNQKTIRPDGYVYVYVLPSDRPVQGSSKSRWLEHRIVMSQVLGRKLIDSETVHHINGDRSDNRPKNLEVHLGRHGRGQLFRCRACGSNDIETLALKGS